MVKTFGLNPYPVVFLQIGTQLISLSHMTANIPLMLQQQWYALFTQAHDRR